MNITKVKRGTTVLQTFYYDTQGGNLTLLVVDHIKKRGQQRVYSPQSIITDIAPFKGFIIDEAGNIGFDASEQVVTISTLWYEYVLYNDGSISELITGGSMRANSVDVKDFVGTLGGPITLYIFNGWIRKIMGYNAFPVFGPKGEIEYTEVQLEEIANATPNTDDYDHKRVDGSWIFPELHPEPEPVVEQPIDEPLTAPEDDTL